MLKKKFDYDVIIIGAGSAGITAAKFSGLLRKRVAVVSENIGGDCLLHGCIPSKAFLASAHTLRNSTQTCDEKYEIAKNAVRQAIQQIILEKDNEIKLRKDGVDVYLQRAIFLDSHHVQLANGLILSGKYFLLCTGSVQRPFNFSITNKLYVTSNNNAFSLPHLPARLAIIGGGPIGCEFAQAFKNLGSEVVLFQKGNYLLPKDDHAASTLLEDIFIKDGISILKNALIQKIDEIQDKKVITYSYKSKIVTGVFDTVIVAIGRVPNCFGIGLEKIRVKIEDGKILHNVLLQTTQRHIYLAGDICGNQMFTHKASFDAVIAVQNMFLQKKDAGKQVIGWTTFTDPQIAHVGACEHELIQNHIKYRIIYFPYSAIDRAITDQNQNGFIRIYADKNDMILGAHICGLHAGEIIHEFIIAMQLRLSLASLLSVTHIYPTISSGISEALFEDFLQQKNIRTFFMRFLAKLH